jgi:two-component system, NarL family, nitrate/nitrite response regulator NarL
MEEAHSVLLADDHPIVLSGLKALLGSRADFRVVAACSDGAEALHCLRELEPYLGVLDIHMPGLSGIEVLNITESEGLRTRIVFLTASATDKNVTEAVSGGAWGIVLKDIAAHELIACLKKVAAGDQWFPSKLVTLAFEREAARRKDSERVTKLLTFREQQIAKFVAGGLSNKHIAREARISEATVKVHLHNAYEKLGVSNRTALAMLAHQLWPP